MRSPNATNQKGTSTVSRIIKAPRKAVYDAFIDPELVATWLAPDSMRGEVHEFDASEGGFFRMTLHYINDDHPQKGKTGDNEDSFQGRFAELKPHEKIVEIIEFESADPQFAGEMKMIVTLTDVEGGTNVNLLFENIPAGIHPSDNNKGSEQSLAKLAAMLE